MDTLLLQVPTGDGRYAEIPIQCEKKEGKLKLFSPYNKQLVEEFRAMKNARWEKELGCWSIDYSERNLYALQYLTGYRDPKYTQPINELTDFTRPLFYHQREGVSFVMTKQSCIVAFQMGCGKTLVGIEVMERASSLYNVKRWWLVAPSGAQAEWKRQLKRWKSIVEFEAITTYESLHKVMEKANSPPQGVIFDESVRIKNPSAQRSQYAYQLCRNIRESCDPHFIILLSGAPAPKEPTDWWHQIECCCPGWIREGDIYKFRNRYANIELQEGAYGQYPKVISWKEDELIKLGKRLAPIVIVKKKEDCFDLPKKIYDEIQCDQESEQYKRMEKLTLFIADTSLSAIEVLEKCRELSDGFQYDHSQGSGQSYTWLGSAKEEIIRQLLEFYHTDSEGCGRLVIYASFKATIDKLQEIAIAGGWLPMVIDGRNSTPNHIEMVLDKFGVKTSIGVHLPNVVIIANPACVHGLSFVETDCLVYYSNSFSVDHRIQSEDRRDRPGMDITKGTRVIDILNLETDRLILNRLKQGKAIQSITLEEIKRCLRLLK